MWGRRFRLPRLEASAAAQQFCAEPGPPIFAEALGGCQCPRWPKNTSPPRGSSRGPDVRMQPSGDEMEFPPGRGTKHSKVSSVESKHRVDSFAIGEVHESCVRELNSKRAVSAENRRNARQVCLIESSEFERLAPE